MACAFAHLRVAYERQAFAFPTTRRGSNHSTIFDAQHFGWLRVWRLFLRMLSSEQSGQRKAGRMMMR